MKPWRTLSVSERVYSAPMSQSQPPCMPRSPPTKRDVSVSNEPLRPPKSKNVYDGLAPRPSALKRLSGWPTGRKTLLLVTTRLSRTLAQVERRGVGVFRVSACEFEYDASA